MSAKDYNSNTMIGNLASEIDSIINELSDAENEFCNLEMIVSVRDDDASSKANLLNEIKTYLAGK